MFESSGLLYFDGYMWTFNDSGGEAALYCFDPSNGSVIRKTTISNAINVDWEDIAADETHVYIADVGNNSAGRDTLTIYRIPKNELTSGDTLVSYDGIITFSFKEVVEKNSFGYSSHDCEALFAYGDSLYLFSKNWVDETTSVYVIPAEPGHHHITPRYQYDARILVTGADLSSGNQEVALVGYRNHYPIVIRYGFTDDPGQITCGGKARFYPMKLGRQVEGICFDASGEVFVSSEKSLRKQTLFKLGRPLR